MQKLQTYLTSLLPLSTEAWAEGLTYFSKQKLNKGEIFIQQHELCRHIGFVAAGSLRVFFTNEQGEDITSCFCTENMFTTSFKSFVAQQPSALTVIALEDTELYVISYDNLQKLYSISTGWQNIGRILTEKAYLSLEQHSISLNKESARDKYLRLLEEQPKVLLTAKMDDIASYLGVTRRTLSRIRSTLAKA
mgnify:CR=1 FL=1